MFRYLLLSLLVAGMFWENADGCPSDGWYGHKCHPRIPLCEKDLKRQREKREASFDDIISEAKTLENAVGEYWIQKSKNMTKGLCRSKCPKYIGYMFLFLKVVSTRKVAKRDVKWPKLADKKQFICT